MRLADGQHRDVQSAAESDPRDADGENRTAPNVRRNSQVTQAKYEPDAPESTNLNSMRTPQPTVLSARPSRTTATYRKIHGSRPDSRSSSGNV